MGRRPRNPLTPHRVIAEQFDGQLADREQDEEPMQAGYRRRVIIGDEVATLGRPVDRTTHSPSNCNSLSTPDGGV
jgi:hypothetical protein